LNAEELVKAMDACGIEKVVDMGGSQEEFEGFIKNFRDKYPDRFILFTRLNLNQIKKPNFPEDQLTRFDYAIRMGARGLKVIKSLGLEIQDKSGRLVHIDDPRFDPIWEKAAEYGVPVLMHLGDPTPFFAPIDRYNERYEELIDFPQWSFYGPKFQTKEALRAQRENLVKKHPRTIFIMAHMGDDVENLSYLASLFDKYPNYYVDLSARLPELGRQPYTSREFFIKYQDRILFGSDGGYALDPKGEWTAERYFRSYFEFLETRNEYFEYPLWGIQKQGRWRIYGIELPDEVLKKIYYKNAEKILSRKSIH
jgi:predicted TIM-barrel fold metal-dependent hydrolase